MDDHKFMIVETANTKNVKEMLIKYNLTLRLELRDSLLVEGLIKNFVSLMDNNKAEIKCMYILKPLEFE